MTDIILCEGLNTSKRNSIGNAFILLSYSLPTVIYQGRCQIFSLARALKNLALLRNT